MSFKNMTPGQRKLMRDRALETRMLKKAEKEAEVNKAKAAIAAEKAAAPAPEAAPPAEVAEPVDEMPAAGEAPTLASLGIVAAPDDDFFGYVIPEDERRRIEAEARAQVEAEERAKVVRAYKAQALDDARRRSGAMPEDEERLKELAELTTVRIHLPKLRLANGRECPPDPIIIDQRMFMHGQDVRVTRGQGEYLVYLMAERWKHQAQVDGRSRNYYNEDFGRVMWNGQAPASGGSAGPSFDSVHKRPDGR
jgi:hypothetical protein